MSLDILLAKIVGLLLFAWTAKSIYHHVSIEIKQRTAKPDEAQSISEDILNKVLLYLWLTFMVVFSLGMVFNN